jgi:hypothetical protein
VEITIESQGNKYDITHLCPNIEWKTQLNQASTLKVGVKKVDGLSFSEGDIIKFIDNDNKIFKGYIFTKGRDKSQVIDITAYDQLRYLKNKDTFVFKNKTASDIAKHIFENFNLKYGTIQNTGYIIEQLIEDNKTLLDIIQGSLDRTLIATGNIFVLYDDFGDLTIKNINELRTNLVIGDESLVYDFKYTTSIDNDVYNKVKLFRDNKTTGKREVYIVMDSNNMKKWGTLQYSEKVNENLPEGKVKQQAENLLKTKNRLKRTLSMECIGDFRLKAGHIVGAFIKDLGDIHLNQLMIIENATHKIEGGHHTMTLSLLYEG